MNRCIQYIDVCLKAWKTFTRWLKGSCLSSTLTWRTLEATKRFHITPRSRLAQRMRDTSWPYPTLKTEVQVSYNTQLLTSVQSEITWHRLWGLAVCQAQLLSKKKYCNMSTWWISSTTGDSMQTHNGQRFSTLDQDRDNFGGECAKRFLGGFWYNNCHDTNPNGIYRWGPDATLYAIGVTWHSWRGHDYSLKGISMKIRPTN